jgi:hypothetical protein
MLNRTLTESSPFCPDCCSNVAACQERFTSHPRKTYTLFGFSILPTVEKSAKIHPLFHQKWTVTASFELELLRCYAAPTWSGRRQGTLLRHLRRRSSCDVANVANTVLYTNPFERAFWNGCLELAVEKLLVGCICSIRTRSRLVVCIHRGERGRAFF